MKTIEAPDYIKKAITPPGYVASVMTDLTSNGFDAYVVGGCLRDAFIGISASDWDIATSATPAQVEEIFPGSKKCGRRFGTMIVTTQGSSVEVTTLRIDGVYNDNRHPESVEFTSCIFQDLKRRDFTMNAIAQSMDGAIIDPFCGVEDIGRKIIRCVGDPNERFCEDALRMLRAFRFRAVLGFEIEKNTLRAVEQNAEKIKKISAERIRNEVEKTLLSDNPQIAAEMISYGLLPGVDSGRCGIESTDVRLSNISGLPKEVLLRWCCLFARIAEATDFMSTETLISSLRFDKKTEKTMKKALALYCGSISGSSTEKPAPPIEVMFSKRSDIKAMIAKNSPQVIRCLAAILDTARGADVALSCETDEYKYRARSSLSDVEEILAAGECISLSQLAINGGDLIAIGYKPGRDISRALQDMLDFVIEYPDKNKKDILINLFTTLKAQKPGAEHKQEEG